MNYQDEPQGLSLRYARLHLLARDHLAEPIPLDSIFDLQKEAGRTWMDDSGLPCIPCIPSVNIDERLVIDKSTAILLAETAGSTRDLNIFESSLVSLLDVRLTKKLRIELPLLRTNLAVDFQAFARLEQPCIDPGSFPSEPVDNEKNEGLKWPSAWIPLPLDVEKTLRKEKFEVGKDALFCLQGHLRDRWSIEDDRKVWDGTVVHKKFRILEPVSPPLLPKSSPNEPYIPSSPTCLLPLLSDPASLILDDLEAIERIIFEQDAVVGTVPENLWLCEPPAATTIEIAVKPQDCYPLLCLSDDELSQPVRGHLKTENHKIEAPLLPVAPVPAPSATLELNLNVDEMLSRTSFVPPGQDASLRRQSPSDCIFTEACLNQINTTQRQLEQEQLLEADSTQRVRIPVMDFTLPIPPWKSHRGFCTRSDLLAMHLEFVSGVLRNCGSPLKLLETHRLLPRLKWSPFSLELGRVTMDEEFGADDVFRLYLTTSNDQEVVDSSGLTWKPEGLRILKEEVDEDDLEPGHFIQVPHQDIASLVRKRKMHLEENARFSPVWSSMLKDMSSSRQTVLNCESEISSIENKMQMNGTRQFQGLNNPSKNSSGCCIPPVDVGDERFETSPVVGINLSVGDAVDNFLEIRGLKRQKLVNSNFPKNISEPPQDSVVDQIPILPGTDIPIPNIVPSLGPASFIISTELIKNRPIKHAIADLYPSAVLIERDFRVHDSVAWLKPTSVVRSPISSPLAEEADLLLSPSTGLVITTLTKIMQKPLPGQKSKVVVREHIEKVSERFESLVVLIGEGTADGASNGLDSSSCVAIAEFAGFCGSLSASAAVHFVGGGENTLAKWVVATMAQFGSQNSNIQLLHDETLWELFLRRAGMNAFAAQAVLADLKRPEDLDLAQTARFGVARFVQMGQEERLRRFGSLLGGTRVLERVSRVLDQKWSQAHEN